MSDRKLLTRRQILSVFGGATGLAIVGVEGQETSTNGNLLGGTSNMAQAYKVGEGTYKGPLSVRSDVPQEDGITFIQTDAGDNNDMFAIQHYNGGWSEQGLDLPSVNTEKLSDVAAYLDPDDDPADWQTTIDDVSANGGGTIVPKDGIYTHPANTTTVLKSGVTLDGRNIGSTLFTVADGLGTDYPNVIRFEPGATDAHVANIEIDGNYQNNPNAIGQSQWATNQTGAGILMEDTANNNRPVRCSVTNSHIHDTVRSPLVASGYDCNVDTVWLSNSAADHWLYVARSIDSEFNNIWCSGRTRNDGIVFGTSGYDCFGNDLNGVRIENPLPPATGNAANQYPKYLAIFRGESGTAGSRRRNTLKDVKIRSENGPSNGGMIRIDQPSSTVGGVRFRGRQDYPLVKVNGGNPSVAVDTIEMFVEDTNVSNFHMAEIYSSDVTLRNATLKEPNTGGYRGVLVSGADETVTDVVIDNTTLDGGSYDALRLAGDANGIRKLGLSNVTESHGRRFLASETVTYASGTMYPQDVTAINNPDEGYVALNDGSNGASGPHVYDGSNWRGYAQASGSTI